MLFSLSDFVGCDIIKDGKTGWFFSLSSVRSLQVAMQRVLSDVAKTLIMGKEARELVAKDFTHAAVANQLAKLYEGLLK